jgi:hypothetical protein
MAWQRPRETVTPTSARVAASLAGGGGTASHTQLRRHMEASSFPRSVSENNGMASRVIVATARCQGLTRPAHANPCGATSCCPLCFPRRSMYRRQRLKTALQCTIPSALSHLARWNRDRHPWRRHRAFLGATSRSNRTFTTAPCMGSVTAAALRPKGPALWRRLLTPSTRANRRLKTTGFSRATQTDFGSSKPDAASPSQPL